MPRFTSPDGTTLAYHPHGDGEPPLRVPGGAGRASSDLGGLAEHRPLVLPDNRGTGESDTPKDPATYHHDLLAHSAGAAMVYAGGADPTSPPARCRDLAALLPTATYLEQPTAGHFPRLDDPRWLVEHLTARQAA